MYLGVLINCCQNFVGETDILEDERPRLKEMVTTRNMVMWHDHSDIFGKNIQCYGPSFSPSLTAFLHLIIELSSLSLFVRIIMTVWILEENY